MHPHDGQNKEPCIYLGVAVCEMECESSDGGGWMFGKNPVYPKVVSKVGGVRMHQATPIKVFTQNILFSGCYTKGQTEMSKIHIWGQIKRIEIKIQLSEWFYAILYSI